MKLATTPATNQENLMKSRNAQSIVRFLTIAVSLCIIAHLSLGSNSFAGETKTSDEGVDNARLVKATQTADEKTEEGLDSARDLNRSVKKA